MWILFLSILLNFMPLNSGLMAAEPLKTEEIPLPPELKEAQTIEPESHFTRDLLNMLTTLGLIVALLYVVSYFLKRLLSSRVQQMNTSSVIKVVEQRSLSPKSSVYLLEVHDKTLVVGESLNGLTLLTTLRQLEPWLEGSNQGLEEDKAKLQ